MKTRYKIAFAATAALIAGSSHAAAYKCQDDKGRTVYSDIPCMKKEAPKADAAPAKAAPVVTAAAAVPITRITEADVLRVLQLSQDYSRSNNYAGLCNLYAADMKFRTEFLGEKGKVVTGSREDACLRAREAFDLFKRAQVVGQTERGATKITIEPGETKAVAVYESVNRLTRYDRIISSFSCKSQDQFILSEGKLLVIASNDVCK